MSYFPLFVDLCKKKILVAGGGEIAKNKIFRLLPYEPDIFVCAPEIDPEIEAIPSIHILHEPFSVPLLDGCFAVIAATDDRSCNAQIAKEAKRKGILVNAVDDKEACSFIFPALIHQKNLTIGITTQGASPSASRYLKKEIEQIIPSHLDTILDWLASQRSYVFTHVPLENQRSRIFQQLFNESMKQKGPLSEEDVRKIIEEVVHGQFSE